MISNPRGQEKHETTHGGGGQATPGTCTITQINGNAAGGGSFVGLDAGSISLTGPAGTYPLQAVPNVKGSYGAQLPANAIPATGGVFTFNGNGGVDIGAFSAAVTFPTPSISWTNQPAAATVNRANGLLVTWTGGQPGSYVSIYGSSANNGAVGAFFCYAPQSALQFMVPAYILAVLPDGQGSTTVQNLTPYSIFTAPRLDYGYAAGIISISVSSTYQ